MKILQKFEVKNVYIVLLQIYAGNCAPYFIRIGRIMWKILQKKTFWSLFFLDTV